MSRRPLATCSLVAVATAMIGCSPPWRPSMESVREVQTASTVDLTDYYPGPVPMRCTFLRRNLRVGEQPAILYPLRLDVHGQRDGMLIDTEAESLAPYLGKADQTDPATTFDWPPPGTGRQLGLFLEFDPPLPYLPMTLFSNSETTYGSDIRVFDRLGASLWTGTVKRTVRVDGYEDVVADGIPFGACLRLSLDTRIRVHWGPWANVSEFLWLARGIGEVKRVQRIQAMAFPLYFDETCLFELAETREAAPVKPAPPRPAPVWARVAIFLDRLLPGLSVGGMLVEYADSPPPGDGADARSPAAANLSEAKRTKRFDTPIPFSSASAMIPRSQDDHWGNETHDPL